ncbi:MAG: phospholipase D-like domain-containing protein, partial [Pseudomonadota bacterium]
MLVSNSINSHKNILNSLLKDCDGTLYIASPYLAEEMGGFLEEFDFSNVERVELITTFKPKNIEQLTKPIQIRDFFNHFKSRYPKMQVIVHVDNYLHGKLYILGKHNRKMIVTSANFTKNGMVGNHEFGLLIEDDTII